MSNAEKHIAIVEDDPDIAVLLQTSLQDAGFQTSTYGNGKSFLSVLGRIKPDVCLVDLGLPDHDGMNLIETIATSSQAVTIIISGQSGADVKITALELGADDYITKPFVPEEVVARVRTVLRRAARGIVEPSEKAIARFGDWELNCHTYELSRPDQGAEPIFLSQGEASVLKVFLDARNRLLTREQILDKVNVDPDKNFDRSIDVRISRLRGKLEEDPRNPTLIKTVYGAGYLFVGQVEWR